MILFKSLFILGFVLLFLFYLKANYYLRAYYLSKGKVFKGWLIPYWSLSSVSESLLLLPFVPYFYHRNLRSPEFLMNIRKGNLYNIASFVTMIVISVLVVVLLKMYPDGVIQPLARD
jgi:hypothetical protein